jgi:hypothetical protein
MKPIFKRTYHFFSFFIIETLFWELFELKKSYTPSISSQRRGRLDFHSARDPSRAKYERECKREHDLTFSRLEILYHIG